MPSAAMPDWSKRKFLLLTIWPPIFAMVAVTLGVIGSLQTYWTYKQSSVLGQHFVRSRQINQVLTLLQIERGYSCMIVTLLQDESSREPVLQMLRAARQKTDQKTQTFENLYGADTDLDHGRNIHLVEALKEIRSTVDTQQLGLDDILNPYNRLIDALLDQVNAEFYFNLRELNSYADQTDDERGSDLKFWRSVLAYRQLLPAQNYFGIARARGSSLLANGQYHSDPSVFKFFSEVELGTALLRIALNASTSEIDKSSGQSFHETGMYLKETIVPAATAADTATDLALDNIESMTMTPSPIQFFNQSTRFIESLVSKIDGLWEQIVSQLEDRVDRCVKELLIDFAMILCAFVLCPLSAIGYIGYARRLLDELCESKTQLAALRQRNDFIVNKLAPVIDRVAMNRTVLEQMSMDDRTLVTEATASFRLAASLH